MDAAMARRLMDEICQMLEEFTVIREKAGGFFAIHEKAGRLFEDVLDCVIGHEIHFEEPYYLIYYDEPVLAVRKGEDGMTLFIRQSLDDSYQEEVDFDKLSVLDLLCMSQYIINLCINN